MEEPTKPPQDNRVNQSTKVILELMEQLSIEHILKAREIMLRTHNEQMALIDDLLKRKGYVPPNTAS